MDLNWTLPNDEEKWWDFNALPKQSQDLLNTTKSIVKQSVEREFRKTGLFYKGEDIEVSRIYMLSGEPKIKVDILHRPSEEHIEVFITKPEVISDLQRDFVWDCMVRRVLEFQF